MSYISGIRPQAAEDAQENASWYGEGAAGPRIYAYTGNDPLNATDPSGDYVQAIQNGNNVTLNFPAVFTGPGATPAAIAAYKQQIQSAWTNPNLGQYNVTLNVTSPAAGTPSSQFNTINIGSLSPNIAGGRPYTSGVGGNVIHLGSLNTGNAATDSYNLWTAGHEAGHAMGLGDMYGPNGPLPGYGGNIMAAYQGVPNGQDIGGILNAQAIGLFGPSAGQTNPGPSSADSVQATLQGKPQ
jgi:hypothetical protein